MLKNAYLDAKIGVDTAENEPSKVLLIFFNFHPPQGFIFHGRTAADSLKANVRLPSHASSLWRIAEDFRWSRTS